MDDAHLPGCDGNHTSRQPCTVPPGGEADAPASVAPPVPPMPRDYRVRYCLRCGRSNETDAVACRRCLTPLGAAAAERVSGLAFLLNEAQYGPLAEALDERDRERMIAEYESELLSLLAPRPIATVPLRPAAVAARPASERESEARETAGGGRAGGPPRPSRQPYDWSWLAEQQANLFLFTGAFLVVVAALIYVAYSGQAVSGALKMSLLAGFTLAFLAAGVVCLRIPRVLTAGQVFFGVGAVLVPLTFVAAYTVLSDRDLDPRALWLAGSLTTALFYTLVATTGLGRPYAYASGVAWISAAAAVAGVAHLHAEWWLAVLIAVSILMSAAALAGPRTLRQNAGDAWLDEARVLVASAMVTAIVIALLAGPEDSAVELTTRWFLPATFAAAAAYASGIAVRLRDNEAGGGAILAIAGALVTTVYALHRPAEEYAIAFAAVSVMLAASLPAIEADALGRNLPGGLSRFARGAGIAATLAAGLVALVIAWAGRSADTPDALVPQTRWFALAASALVLAFYAVDATIRRRRAAITGIALALAAVSASWVYGLGASPEYYALSLTGAGAALVLIAAALPRVPARLLHPASGGDVRMLAHAALVAGVAVALLAMRVQYAAESTYAAQTRWFLFATFASAAAAYAGFVTLPPGRQRWADDARHSGIALALAGACASVVYGLHVSPEYYSFAFAAAAIAVFATGFLLWPRLGIETETAPVRASYLAVAHSAAALAIVVGSAAAVASAAPDSSFHPDSRWFLPALFATLAAFYAIGVASRVPARGWDALAPLGFAASCIGVCAGIVYAMQASAEYYTFAFIVPSIAFAAAMRAGPQALRRLLPDEWREGGFFVTHAAVITGVTVAVVAALAAAPAGGTYHPDTRAYLPLAFLAAATTLALDASRGHRWTISAALLTALGGAGVTVPYAIDANRAYYAAAFAGVGLAYGLGGRAWSPSWLNTRARDAVAAVAVTAAWLPFEGIFAHDERIGAGVHFAAAAYYAIVALTARGGRTLGDLGAEGRIRSAPLATGWLYAAGLAGAIGYVHLWRGLAATEGEGAGALAFPLLGLAIAFVVAAGSARYWRREFGAHLYVMSLVASAACLAAAGDAGVLAAQLSALVAAYVAIAAWENAPALAIPAVVSGFPAVAAWQQAMDAPEYVIPLAYAASALALYAAGFALHRTQRAWSDGARASASAYALVGPAAGFGILAARAQSGGLEGAAFERSALYQWSTAAVAAAGVLAVVESSIARRGWVVVAGSAVLGVALLLEIGRFHPDSAQPYTATVGGYLLVLGIVGVSRFQLIRMREHIAQGVDALGALIVMAPSAVQAWSGGWGYVALLLAEAAVFFSLAVALRRRLLIAVALGAILAVAARALFDAVNALPNWIVVLLVGMALLAIGTAILVGRERWARWQHSVLSWWDEGAPPAHAP